MAVGNAEAHHPEQARKSGFSFRVPCMHAIDEAAIKDHLARDHFFWLDLTAPSDDELVQLREIFGFHPIALGYFEDLYKHIDWGDSSALALFRDDGALIARHPPLPVHFGRSFAAARSFGNHAIKKNKLIFVPFAGLETKIMCPRPIAKVGDGLDVIRSALARCPHAHDFNA